MGELVVSAGERTRRAFKQVSKSGRLCETASGSYRLCGRRRGLPLPRRLLRARGGAALSRDGWRRGSRPTYAALVRPPAAWRARRCAPLCERFCAAVTLHCLSLVLLLVVMLLLLVHMLLLARRGSATRLETRVGSI